VIALDEKVTTLIDRHLQRRLSVSAVREEENQLT
jgi:hypothetical protein